MTALAERISTQTLYVTAVHSVGAVAVVTMESGGGTALPAWEPGAHVDVTLPSGRIRQYSLTSDPDDLSHYRIAVRREDGGRGGSREFHELAEVGRGLEVSAPRNRFPLVDAPSYLLIAGGIGITALLAMAAQLDVRGAPTRLLCLGRGELPFSSELAGLSSVAVETVDTLVVARPDLARHVSDAVNGAVYACGPKDLLQAVGAACDAAPPRHGLHVERFAAEPVASPNCQFDVELVRAGVVVSMNGFTTVLDALRAAGIDAPSSCEQGICGTCETRVLAGAIEHHDDILTEPERAAGDVMMICVSRCSSARLVLDL